MTPRRNTRLPHAIYGAMQPLVELHEVVKVYETAAGDFPALRGVSAEVYPGEFLGIIGKSGAGKSTLLNMITGVVESISGAPTVQGGDVLYKVHIRIDAPDKAMRWGMTVEVTFEGVK